MVREHQTHARYVHGEGIEQCGAFVWVVRGELLQVASVPRGVLAPRKSCYRQTVREDPVRFDLTF